MTARRTPAAHLCLRVGSRHQVAFVPFPARAPMFVIGAAGTLVSFTLPEQIQAGHVDFARQLAAQAWAYAVAVERRYRGLPPLPDTPVPAYDYDRAARDALAFAALFDRFIQNLRRYLGYDVQYFAAVEPQRRLAPHVHIAMRGTVSRAELRRVLAATYHQVWWPGTTTVKYDGDELPVWDEATRTYSTRPPGKCCRPGTRRSTRIGADDEPWHVARFGDRFDAQGVLSGSKDAGRCIGYLTKYLTKQVADCHQRRPTPSVPTPPGWPRRCASSRARRGARTGSGTASSPRTPGPAWPPAGARAKRTTPITSATPGGGSWCSRKWSGKTLADHRADRKEWLLSDARCFGNRPGPLRLGTRRPLRPRSHGPRPADAPRRRRPAPMADRTSRGQETSGDASGRGSSGNWEGGFMANQRDELMTVEQILAELCGVSERTFYRWRELGRAPKGMRLPNRELRVWRSEFLAWLESLREDAA